MLWNASIVDEKQNAPKEPITYPSREPMSGNKGRG
jgi:hypothetical protein